MILYAKEYYILSCTKQFPNKHRYNYIASLTFIAAIVSKIKVTGGYKMKSKIFK